jgi:hypothetical protein
MWLIVIQPLLAALEPSYRRMTGDVPWLVAAWEAPPWFPVLLTLLGIVVIGLSGLVTARLVRPRNRQADIAAGMVAGAVTGVVFFTLCFGWFAGLTRLKPSFNDIGLLSMAAWDDPEEGNRSPARSPRALVREHLLEKYPGLRNVPARERGRVMHEKTACDLCTTIPVSIWSGMFMSVVFCVPFGAFSTAMGGHLLRERGGVRKALLPYLEGMVPLAFLNWGLCIFVTPWLLGGRLNFPLWYFPLLIGVLGLAVTAVLRRWHWTVRLPLHATWIALAIVQPWLMLH